MKKLGSVAGCHLLFAGIFLCGFSGLGIAKIPTCDIGQARSVLVLQDRWVVSGFMNGEVYVFDTQTQKLLTAHPAALEAVAGGGRLTASPTGNRFAALMGKTNHDTKPGWIETFGVKLFSISPTGVIQRVLLQLSPSRRGYERADFGALAFIKAWKTPPLLVVTAQRLDYDGSAQARVIFFNAITGYRYWTFTDPLSTHPIARVDFSKDERFAIIPAHSPGGSLIGVRILDVSLKKEVKFIEHSDVGYRVIDGEYLQFKGSRERIVIW